jgi:hypothetical protein
MLMGCMYQDSCQRVVSLLFHGLSSMWMRDCTASVLHKLHGALRWCALRGAVCVTRIAMVQMPFFVLRVGANAKKDGDMA